MPAMTGINGETSMKVRMLENYQNVEECATDVLEGFRVKLLGKDMEYIVDEAFGKELIENGKAEKIESKVATHARRAKKEATNDETTKN